MDSTYLQTLLEVIEAGSLTKAAENLCVTQSAVSRRLKFIEEQYGLPLFDRSGPQPELTVAGRVISEKSRQLLALEAELEHEIRSRDWTRPLSFCCTPAFGMSHLPEVMRRFMHADRSQQGVEIHFEIPERILIGMRTHHYDLAVIDYGECIDLAGLTAIPLGGDEIVFMSSPSLEISPTKATLADLFEHTLFSRKEGCCSRRCLDGNLEGAGFSVADFHNVVVIDDLHLIVQALVDQRGVAFLPRQVFREEIETGSLVVHRLSGFKHKRSRTLLVGGVDRDNPAVAAFIDCVKDLT